MRLLSICLLLMAFRLFSVCAHAENASPSYVKRPLAAVKTATPPTIDGDLSDPAWKSAPKVETFLDQQTGAIATDQTIAYILYDDKYIYVAFACKDSQPDKITAREIFATIAIITSMDSPKIASRSSSTAFEATISKTSPASRSMPSARGRRG